jgi:predicted small secreted protein
MTLRDFVFGITIAMCAVAVVFIFRNNQTDDIETRFSRIVREAIAQNAAIQNLKGEFRFLHN